MLVSLYMEWPASILIAFSRTGNATENCVMCTGLHLFPWSTSKIMLPAYLKAQSSQDISVSTLVRKRTGLSLQCKDFSWGQFSVLSKMHQGHSPRVMQQQLHAEYLSLSNTNIKTMWSWTSSFLRLTETRDIIQGREKSYTSLNYLSGFHSEVSLFLLWLGRVSEKLLLLQIMKHPNSTFSKASFRGIETTPYTHVKNRRRLMKLTLHEVVSKYSV
jgi:hypothetical protein